MQFEFSIKFHDIAGKSLPLKEVPQVITAGDQGPHELMQADSLGRPACADCAKSTLDIFSLHAESLCQLSRDAAVELGNNGSLAAFSTTYRDCAQLAGGLLGRLYGKKTDESSGQKPQTYRSGSVRSQIQIYKDDINKVRLAFPTINSSLDT